MKIIAAWPRIMDLEASEAYAGGNGFTRYDRIEIDAAFDAWKGFGK